VITFTKKIGDKKTGKISVKKGLKKRTYKVRVKVKAAEGLFCEQFESYARARDLGELAPVRVSLLEPGTQLLYRDKCAVSQKCSEGQLKPVRILDTMEKSKFFHAFIAK